MDDKFGDMADSVHNSHARHDFATMAAASFTGAYVGHKLDQTRFGVWINTSPTSHAIFGVLKTLVIIGVIGLVLVYLYCLAAQF